jgi:hypothetical protein
MGKTYWERTGFLEAFSASGIVVSPAIIYAMTSASVREDWVTLARKLQR